MPFTLYDATIPNFLQQLGAVSKLLEKAEAWCAERQLDPAEIVGARLAPDMFPFAYQVKSTVVHSLGAIEGARRGVFSPDLDPPPETLAALKAKVDEAIAKLQALDPAEVNGFMGRDAAFEFRERRIEFTAEDFLQSFSMPNFWFHATTVYAILRWKGLPIGKKDFTGRLRIKAK